MEKKTCYQSYLSVLTPCFNMAGGTPCSAVDCLVEKSLDETPFVYQSLIESLCHTTCRMSADSPNNQEFLVRVAKR